MIGADTNLLVRFLVKDVEKQASKVNSLLKEGEKLYINEIVLSELFWVLTSVYQYSKNEFIFVLDILLETKNIYFFDNKIVRAALSDFIHSQAEFSDCLIHEINLGKGLDTLTFDKKAARLKRMKILG